MSHPPIAIPAYNRPEALARLLASLAAAEYPAANIPLIVAIDAGGARGTAVREVAARFHWPHGPYEVIHHPTNVGLIGNVFFCGRLALQHGAVILLEDDLVVSRAFYDYALQARTAYSAENIGVMDMVILMVKATQTDGIMPSVMPCIGSETVVVSLQNGIGNDDVLKKYVPADRILYGFGTIGTELPEPGKCVSMRLHRVSSTTVSSLPPAISSSTWWLLTIKASARFQSVTSIDAPISNSAPST